MKYRKKPVVIEAIQFNGFNPQQIKDFVGDACSVDYNDAAYQAGVRGVGVDIIIHTLEGDMKANRGDYVIKGVSGEFYPCKPDIFEQSYEPVVRT